MHFKTRKNKAMKKVLLFFALAVVCLTMLLGACIELSEPIKDNALATSGPAGPVKIGGITWAAYNVDSFQTFATRPDMYTKFYQWNREAAWSAAGSVSGWNSTADQSATWTVVNPCPAGWRLPTRAELTALNNAGSSWANANARGNAVAGRFYGLGHATASLPNNMGNCVFLPAAGYRTSSIGSLSSQGSRGYYWSGTQCSSANGSSLAFSSSGSNPSDGTGKAFGFSLRCVQ